MNISLDKVNMRYVVRTKVDLPPTIIKAYDVVSGNYDTDTGIFVYQLPSWEPNFQHLVDYIITVEAKS
jgi:hypothetical protein